MKIKTQWSPKHLCLEKSSLQAAEKLSDWHRLVVGNSETDCEPFVVAIFGYQSWDYSSVQYRLIGQSSHVPVLELLKKKFLKIQFWKLFWIFYLSDSTRFLSVEHVWIRVRFGVYVVTLDTRINTWLGQDWSGHKIRNNSRIICEQIWSIRSSKSKNKNPQKSTTNKNFQRL